MRTRVHGLHGESRGSLSSSLLSLLPLLPLVAMVVASPARAQNEYGQGDPTTYVSVSALAAFDDRGDLWMWNWGDATVDPGATVRAGLRLGAPLGFELQGDWIDLDQFDDNDNWTITANFRVYPTLIDYDEDFGFDLPLKDIFPEILQPYMVAGVGVMGGTGDNGDNYQLTGAFRLGAGTDLYVTPKLAICFGYEWITGTSYWAERDTRNLVLGLQYNF